MKNKIAIHHFHIDNNAPCSTQTPPPPPPPPKFCITIAIVRQKKVALWCIWKWWICEQFFLASSELTVVPKPPLLATWLSCMAPLFRDIRELLQRKRFRLRERNYENESAFFQTLSRLFQLAQNAKSGLEFAENSTHEKEKFVLVRLHPP